MRLGNIEGTIEDLQTLLGPLQAALIAGLAEVREQFTSDIGAVNEKLDAMNEAITADFQEAKHLHTDIAFLTQDVVDDTNALIEKLTTVEAGVVRVGSR